MESKAVEVAVEGLPSLLMLFARRESSGLEES